MVSEQQAGAWGPSLVAPEPPAPGDLPVEPRPCLHAVGGFPAARKATGQPSGEQGCFPSGDEGLALTHPPPDSTPRGCQDCDLPDGQPRAGAEGMTAEHKGGFLLSQAMRTKIPEHH